MNVNVRIWSTDHEIYATGYSQVGQMIDTVFIIHKQKRQINLKFSDFELVSLWNDNQTNDDSLHLQIDVESIISTFFAVIMLAGWN